MVSQQQVHFCIPQSNYKCEQLLFSTLLFINSGCRSPGRSHHCPASHMGKRGKPKFPRLDTNAFPTQQHISSSNLSSLSDLLGTPRIVHAHLAPNLQFWMPHNLLIPSEAACQTMPFLLLCPVQGPSVDTLFPLDTLNSGWDQPHPPDDWKSLILPLITLVECRLLIHSQLGSWHTNSDN